MTDEQSPVSDHRGLPGLAGKRVFIETYGCRYNFGTTAKLTGILNQMGCTVSDTIEGADAVIVNTCSVVSSTERRMLRRLSELRDHRLYVTGCMPEVQRDVILAVCNPVFIRDADIQEQYRHSAPVATGSTGIVQIAQGCLGSCSYCITRLARGALKSVPLAEIRSQVAAFADAGAAEIQLTAQDAGAWGRDCGFALPNLLHALEDPKGNFRLRVGMMNPATVIDILEDLVGAFSAENLFRFIHVPVQSGSDRILRKMNRGYCCEDFEQIVTAFRRRYPDITVATDMIAGFPGECDEDHRLSLDLIRRLRFDKVNVTRYSPRPYTPAYSYPDTPDAVKKERSRSLQACAEEVAVALHEQYVGGVLPFIVTEHIRKGTVMARAPNYLGIVLPGDLPPGFSGTAEILEGRTYFLKGKHIQKPGVSSE